MTAAVAEATPASGTSEREQGRRADIQGLRGVAVLLVVIFHTDLALPGGFTGVDVFFVISGFVITALLVRGLESEGGRIDLATFYARRVRRLLPALALVLSVVAIASVLFLNPLYGNSLTGASPEGIELRPQSTQSQTALTAAGASLLAANAELYKATNGYFDPGATANPLLHTWSLSVEEQFYLGFPLLLVLCWRLHRRPRRWAPRTTAVIVLGAAAVTSFGLCVVLTKLNQRLAFYASPARVWEFAVGGLLALVAPRLTRLPASGRLLLGIVGGSMILAGGLAITATVAFPGTAALLPVAGAAAVLAAGTGGRSGVSSLLEARPLVWLGDVSYGWYLWHWPFIVFTQALWPSQKVLLPVAAVVSLVPTWLSYRFVEQPVRHSTRLRGRRLMAMGTALVAAPIACAALLLFAANEVRQLPSVRTVSSQVALHADVLNGCDSALPLGDRRSPQCTTTAPGSTGRVVLVGDSNAGQFTEPVAAAAAALHLDFTVATFSGCPFVNVVVDGPPPFDSAGCQRFVSETTQDLIELRPTLVLLASSSTGFITDDDIRLSSGAGARTESSPAGKAALWGHGLSDVIRDLSQGGIPVLVIHTIPHFESFDLFICAGIRLYVDAPSCGTSLTRHEAGQQRMAGLAAERSAIEKAPGAAGLDLEPDLCSPTTCATNRDETWTYRDGGHLSVGGALALTDRFTAEIRRTAQPTGPP